MEQIIYGALIGSFIPTIITIVFSIRQTKQESQMILVPKNI